MKRPSTRRLGVETLETRNLMAGNVTVSVSGGDLIVTGDNAANVITIQQVSSNRFRVAGQNTTINGKTTPKTVTVSNNIMVKLNGGNDQISVGVGNKDTILKNDLSIFMGLGSDTITTRRLRGRNSTLITSVFTEVEADTIVDNGSIFTGKATIKTGGGSDKLTLNRSQALGSLDADVGAGNDFASIISGHVGDLILKCGRGNDRARFSGQNVITGVVTADGGTGVDTATQANGTTYVIDLGLNHSYTSFEESNIDL